MKLSWLIDSSLDNEIKTNIVCKLNNCLSGFLMTVLFIRSQKINYSFKEQATQFPYGYTLSVFSDHDKVPKYPKKNKRSKSDLSNVGNLLKTIRYRYIVQIMTSYHN